MGICKGIDSTCKPSHQRQDRYERYICTPISFQALAHKEDTLHLLKTEQSPNQYSTYRTTTMKIIMLASLIAPAAAFIAPGARTSATRYAATRTFSGSSSLFANPKGTSHRHVKSRLHAVSVTRRIITNASFLFSGHPYM